MVDDLIQVIFDDADLLVVNKPADLVCHPTKGDALSSLISRVRLYLGNAADVHLINRLDRETSGVVVVAKNREAARELRAIWESRRVRKEYWAIVYGAVRERHGTIEAPLGRDEESQVAIKDCVRADGAAAQTEFWTEKRFTKGGQDFSWLRVVPITGRKHQIRIHLAHSGHAIVGDKLYGISEDYYLALVEGRLSPAAREALLLPCHALHARSVRFDWRGLQREFKSEPEKWFLNFLGAEAEVTEE